MRSLKVKKLYEQGLETRIFAVLADVIFGPIEKILADVGLRDKANASESLKNFIFTGKIQYIDGKFHGKFNSKISKELIDMGAKFNLVTKTYDLVHHAISQELLQIIALSNTVIKSAQEKLISILSEPLIETYSFSDKAGMVIDDLDLESKKALKDSIAIVPEFSPKLKQDLIDGYNKSLNEAIVDFSDKEIEKLRNLVSENYLGGWRLDRLETIIEQEYGVTKRKAKFLARQETSLLVAKYTELRYKEMGITKFRWSAVSDGKTRDEHKELNGQIFSFDDPPIIDKITGKRGLPGQAFGCRCSIIPVIERF